MDHWQKGRETCPVLADLSVREGVSDQKRLYRPSEDKADGGRSMHLGRYIITYAAWLSEIDFALMNLYTKCNNKTKPLKKAKSSDLFLHRYLLPPTVQWS